MGSLTTRQIRQAERRLAASHPAMARLIAGRGPCQLKPAPDPFVALCRTIVSQMISTKAAECISTRLSNLVAPEPLTPKKLIDLETEQLRGIGLSSAKCRTLKEIASRILTHEMQLDDAAVIPDEELYRRLIDIPGVGPWSIHMFQIFVLCRPDILPIGDLGLRAGVKDLYGLPELPSPAKLQEIAEPWRPFATVGTWYIWRSRDPEDKA